MKDIANFFYEAGMLAKTPRAGFHFLGSGKQSVAEHMNRMGYIVYALAKLDGTVDLAKMLEMAMFHDFAEARTSDLNYVQQKYVQVDEDAAVKDMTAKLPFGNDIHTIIEEYEERESREAVLVKEADILELLLTLKEEIDTGNTQAKSWIPSVLPRLKTGLGKSCAYAILNTDFDAWWFGDKEDDWWVTRNKK